MYAEPKNNPMFTNEQRKQYQQNKPPEKGQEPLLNLQLYQPPKPKPPQQRPNPAVFFPNYVPNPFNPADYANYMQYQYGNIPLIKEYNINIGGVSGSHISTAILYEDIMPLKNVSTSFSTIGERMMMYEYVRSNLFQHGDGYDMAIDDSIHGGGNSKNLLSKIKFMDLNPYNSSRFTNNPYRGLPFGFFLFRSCYPIRHNTQVATAMCAPNSTGINVRIYRITDDTYLVNKQHLANIYDYDEWREIGYYNYVKENIVKKKVSPNFVTMYGYSLTLNSGIRFDELFRIQMPHVQMVPRVNTPNVTNQYTGKVIVCLTEASNYSLLKWCSSEYKSEGNIRRMINSGYHPKNVWYGVIFQLLSALYCMQKNGIVINNFKLDRNVFIKDINVGGNVTHYWKYVINGIEYYIPNHGYIVLIDTNFRDFEDTSWYNRETDQTRQRKLEGLFVNPEAYSRDDISNKTFAMFKGAIDPNIFDSVFVTSNGIKPPEDVIRLLNDMQVDASTNNIVDISYYIRKYMTMFLNNRIGDLLTESEKLHVKIGGLKDFRNGQIVVWYDSFGFDRFVIHVNTNDSGGSRIITKENKNFIEKDVPNTSLNEYSHVEPIKQTFKIDASNLNEESLLETYYQ